MDHFTKADLIRLYEGGFSEEEGQRAEQHLNNCPECQFAMESVNDEQRTAWARREQKQEPEPPCIPGYRDFEYVGKGGFGVVFKGRQESLNRIVVLKKLRHDRNDPKNAERLRKEADLLVALKNKNIVEIHEILDWSGQPVLVLEYCEGGSLSAKINGPSLAPRKVAGEIKTLATAVQVVHNLGIVHRDLKPDNILLQGEVLKIADFGLAEHCGEEAKGDDSYWKGTPAYMAPEQVNPSDFGAVNPKAADVYALGSILYEMLSGKPPFEGANVAQILQAVKSEPPAPLRRWNKRVPRDLEAICLKCLKKAPDNRYSCAEELAKDLARFEASMPVEARKPWSIGYRTKKFTQRNPGLTAFGMLLLASTIVSVLLMLRASSQERAAVFAADQARLAEDKAQKQADAARNSAINLGAILEKLDPSSSKKGRANLNEQLLVNLRKAKRQMEQLVSEDRLTGARFAVILGSTFRRLGQMREARELLETALPIFKTEQGIDSMETLAVAHLLAACYSEEGEYEKGILLSERTYKKRQASLGPDNVDTLDSLQLFAVFLYGNEQYDEALSLLEPAFDTAKAKLNATHETTLTIQINLSAMYRDRGEPDKARSLLEASLEQVQKEVGMERISALFILNLADSCIAAGRADIVTKEMEAMREFFPAMSQVDIGLALSYGDRLLDAYQSSSQFDKGEKLLDEWLRVVRAKTGSDSLPAAIMLQWQAWFFLKSERFAEAETVLRDCLNILKQKSSTEQKSSYLPERSVTLLLLGEALLGQKKFSESEALLKRGWEGLLPAEKKLSLMEKSRWKRHLAESLSLLVQLYEAVGQKQQADAWRNRVEDSKRRWQWRKLEGNRVK